MDVSSADGTAVAGSDYVAIASGTTLTIPAGEVSGTVEVGIIGDINDEADETFLVNLLGPANDVPKFNELLVKKFGFAEKDVTRLVGWPDDPTRAQRVETGLPFWRNAKT